MKSLRNIVLLVLAFAVLPSPVAHSVDVKIEKIERFDINVRDASLRSVLEVIARKAGLSLEAAPEVTGNVSLNVVDGTLDQALKELSSKNRLRYSVESGVLHVVALGAASAADRKPASLDSFGNPLASAQGTPNGAIAPLGISSNPAASMKVIALHYVKASEMAPKVLELFGRDVRVVADDNTNALLVAVLHGDSERLNKFIRDYDTMPKQILIEAQIVETSDNFTRELGVSWGNLSPAGGGTSTGLATIPQGANISVTNPAPSVPNISAGFSFGSINSSRLQAQLMAAETRGDAKIISRPKIVTADRLPATIESGITYHVKTLSALPINSQSASSSGSSTGGSQGGDSLSNISGGLQEVTAGLNLLVTPDVVDNNLIRLKIVISSSEADQGNSVDGIPGITKSSAKTSIIVREGVTATIGGLIKYSTNSTHSGVPFLESIPLLGWFFRASTWSHQNSEMIIFITPHLLPDPNAEASL